MSASLLSTFCHVKIMLCSLDPIIQCIYFLFTWMRPEIRVNVFTSHVLPTQSRLGLHEFSYRLHRALVSMCIASGRWTVNIH